LLVWVVQQAVAVDASDFTSTGYSLLATLIALALLEHWFLVLPLPTELLWRWSMRADAARNKGAAITREGRHETQNALASDACAITPRII
jgi:Flp pilus assembly pilin Flp